MCFCVRSVVCGSVPRMPWLFVRECGGVWCRDCSLSIISVFHFSRFTPCFPSAAHISQAVSLRLRVVSKSLLHHFILLVCVFRLLLCRVASPVRHRCVRAAFSMVCVTHLTVVSMSMAPMSRSQCSVSSCTARWYASIGLGLGLLVHKCCCATAQQS